MSQADRDKWNLRYREGAYADRTHPSAFLTEWIDKLPPGRALDVACGAGRNALFLAGQGYQVSAVDISVEALNRGRQSAQQQGVTINWYECDLEEPLLFKESFDLIILIRYVDLPLLEQLTSLVAPGGMLLCEQHLQTTRQVIGPSNPAFRVKAGELSTAVSDLELLCEEEGLFTEPDGRVAALSRVVVQQG